MIQPSADILERNLSALQASSPRVVEMVRRAASRGDVEFAMSEEGVASASMRVETPRGVVVRALASRRRPLEEAAKLAGTIDVADAAAVAALGFGVGYHVRAVAQKMKRTGVVFVFEPDVALLRAVLERVDHSAWIRGHNVCLLTDAEDGAAILSAARGVEGLLALGFKLLQHPADRVRLGAAADRFSERFTEVIKAVRTTVVTTLVQAEVTLRNQLMNIDRYATTAGVTDLHGSMQGRPAIVVAAGPSLRRNIELLSKPGVRDRFVIIAVQTVLKTLLARGIKPHFVTALDYHEISRRFYEGLTPKDVEGVTLVVEAKANPAILEAFPGALRMPGDRFLDEFLGEPLVREFHGRSVVRELPGGVPSPAEATLPPGATVAHMAYYLARKLGCDPVILIGQDLGFTDGQYYAPGAAIHTVWSGELNTFNSLEMMEWQRIARGKYHVNTQRTVEGVTLPSEPNLVQRQDVHGRPIYTDQQMATYLAQFERDFRAHAEQGFTTIDATEGGVAKAFTTAMRLAEAIERYGPGSELRVPAASSSPDPGTRLRKLRDRVRGVRQDVWKVGEMSRKTVRALTDMLEHHQDQSRVNRLIEQVQRTGQQVEAIQPAFTLVQHLNQTGALKRVREDRKIGLDESLSPLERQKRQIERDVMNVGWIADAADQLGRMLDDTIRMLDGGARVTRDLATPEDGPVPGGMGRDRQRIAALIAVDADRGGMGTPRPLGASVAGGLNPLTLTLRRLARCRQLDGVVLVGENAEAIRELAGEVPGLRYEVVRTDGSPLAARLEGIRGARLWSAACWRGGLATMTVFDEALAPAAMNETMERLGLDAAVVVGADWCLVDPGLVDECVDRYRRQTPGPGAYRVSFCQAPPGLGVCLLDRGMMRDLAERAESAGVFASLGGVLGYMPLMPTPDPIAKPACITTDARVRDANFRFIPDSPDRAAAIGSAIERIGERSSLFDVVEAVLSGAGRGESPREVTLELCTGRRTSGLRGQWMTGLHDTIERPCLPLSLAGRLLSELGHARPDAALTLYGAGDPVLHPDLVKIVSHAKKVGIAGVHIRTDLLCDEDRLDDLLHCGADVISVDLMAGSAATYQKLMGVDQFDRVRKNLEVLIERRSRRQAGIPVPWIVPRLTRCDAVYEEIEAFYDHWLLAAGAAVIDPLPMPIPGDRIEPLPLPTPAARRMAESSMTILCDGTVAAQAGDLSGERTVGDAGRDGLAAVWARVHRHEPKADRPAQVIEPAGTRPLPPTRPLVHAGRSRVARLDAGL